MSALCGALHVALLRLQHAELPANHQRSWTHESDNFIRLVQPNSCISQVFQAHLIHAETAAATLFKVKRPVSSPTSWFFKGEAGLGGEGRWEGGTTVTVLKPPSEVHPGEGMWASPRAISHTTGC